MNFLYGFIAGFIVGLIIVKYKLHGIPPQELRNNKALQKKYGPIVWICAFVTGLVFMFGPRFL